MGYRSMPGIGGGGPFDKARRVTQRPRFQTEQCLVLHLLPESPVLDKARQPAPRRSDPPPEPEPGVRD
jgi:hypothetical protein